MKDLDNLIRTESARMEVTKSEPVIAQLHRDLGDDLTEIAARFKNPLITLIVRNPDVEDGDVVLSNDPDSAKVMLAYRTFLTQTGGHKL